MKLCRKFWLLYSLGVKNSLAMETTSADRSDSLLPLTTRSWSFLSIMLRTRMKSLWTAAFSSSGSS